MTPSSVLLVQLSIIVLLTTTLMASTHQSHSTDRVLQSHNDERRAIADDASATPEHADETVDSDEDDDHDSSQWAPIVQKRYLKKVPHSALTASENRPWGIPYRFGKRAAMPYRFGKRAAAMHFRLGKKSASL